MTAIRLLLWNLCLGIFINNCSDVSKSKDEENSKQLEEVTETSLTYFNFVKTIMERECVSCHGEEPAPGSPDTLRLDTYEDIGSVLGVYSTAERIAIRVENKTMPPPDTGTMTDEEIAGIVEWFAGGAPKGEDPDEKEEDPDSTTDLTYYNFAKEVLDRECATCHTIPPTDGAPDNIRFDSYADRDGVSATYSMRARLKATIQNATMPPPGTGNLTDEEKTKLIEWVDGGAPEGTATQNQLNPGVTITAPGGDATANETFTIQVSFTETSSGATWAAYYSSTAGTTSGGTLISDNIDVATTSMTWDTSAVAVGIYYIYIVLTDPVETLSVVSSNGITISHPEPGNTTPTIAVTSPNGGESWEVDSTQTISWTITDPDPGDKAGMDYALEYSSDNGSSWTELATLSGANTNYSWSIPTNQTKTQTYLVRITANDGKGGIDSDSSDAAFEIKSPAVANPTYADFDAIAQNYCSGGGCHNNAGGGKNDYTNNEASVVANKAAIKSEIEANTMPKNGTLPSSDKETMLNYLNSL